MKRFLVGFIVACAMAAVTALPARAQGSARLARHAALPVYLDCQYLCDTDYIHTQITFLNWVRDRTVADVDVLTSTETTGAGGTQYTFTFVGERRFAGMADTLSFSVRPDATPDDIRRAMVHTLRVGLVRYLAHTSAASRLAISMRKAPVGAGQTTPAHDPWHAWVFTTSFNEDAYEEQQTRYTFLDGGFSANRVTPAWKIDLSTYDSYNENRFYLQNPDTTIVSIERSLGLSALIVKSLGQHWSVGAMGSLASSTFLNERRDLLVMPAVEFDVWPYAQSTHRQLRLLYGIGANVLAYDDTTIFLKTGQTLPVHAFAAAYSQQEPWGTMSVGVNTNAYLNDGSKRRADLSTSLSLRIVRGLSLNLSADYSAIHDQIYLAKGTATQAEILLQQRQLLTSYEWSGFVGLSYTFGSLFNNVVNPRFGSGATGTLTVQ